MSKKLIMVMGVQRSGTTVLFHSLAKDQTLTLHNESWDDAVYYCHRLRPLAEIAPVLEAARGAVLLKPLSETGSRSLDEIAAEYRDYNLRFVWIYRDPVNVLYSMHRKGWIPGSQIDHTSHISEWVRRNQLAVQFQQRHPDQIALARYEDCYADPMVFRQMAAWLGVKGQSLFRQDRAQGRRYLSRAVQQEIDRATAPILDALDIARTFRARPLYRAKLNATKFIARFPDKLRRVRNGGRTGATPGWDATVLAAQPVLPSQVDGLQYWLDAGEKSGVDLHESGPHHLKAHGDPPCPLHIPFLNGKHALFFPREKAATRREGTPGILHFGTEEAWSFLFHGRPFSLVAFFRPRVPTIAPNDQERAVLLRIGSPHRPPALILEWDGQMQAAKVILLSGETGHPSIVATASGTHPHKEWRVVFFQKDEGNETRLSISVNGFAASSVVMASSPGRGSAPGADCTLQLGGDEAQRDALFFGAIAELIFFDRSLATAEQRGIARYLKDKYCL